MKKAMQWYITGILTLVIGLSSGMTIFYGNTVLRIGEFDVYFGSPFVTIFSITFGFMCFIFGVAYELIKD